MLPCEVGAIDLVELVKSWLAPIDLKDAKAWRNEIASAADPRTKARRECPLLKTARRGHERV